MCLRVAGEGGTLQTPGSKADQQPDQEQDLSTGKWVKIRMSEDARADIRRRADAAGMTVSDLIRESLDQPAQRRRQTRHITADPELIRAVARVGNNLNQIARAVNVGADIQLISHLISIEQQLSQLIEVLPDAQ